MDRDFDTELQKLKDLILSMGGNVEQAIEHATQALLVREPERLNRVFELEDQVNKSHITVTKPASICWLAKHRWQMIFA